MYDGFEDVKTRLKQVKPLIRPYVRHEHFEEEFANGDISGENMLIVLSDLFKEGRLSADHYLHALSEPAS